MTEFKKIFVPLNGPERSALAQLAQRERRDPRDQAAYVIRQHLEQLGLIQPVTIKGKEGQDANGNQ